MTLNCIKNALFAAMHGMTPEEYELQKARDNLKSVTDNFLDQHPELLKSASSDTPTDKRGFPRQGVSSAGVVNVAVGSSVFWRPFPDRPQTTDHADPAFEMPFLFQ